MHGHSLPWWIHAAAFVVLAAQVIALLRSLMLWRTKPWASVSPVPLPRLWPTIGLVCLWLALPAAAVAFTEPGRRALIELGLGPFNPDLPYFQLDPEPWDRYSALFHVTIWSLPGAFLTALALTFTISSRWKTLTARTPIAPSRTSEDSQVPSTLEVGAVAFSFVLCALVPFLLGIWIFGQRLQKVFEMSAGRPPGEKENLILSGLANVTHPLKVGAAAGAFGLFLAILIAILFMRRWQKQGVTWPQEKGRSRRAALTSVVVLLLAGIVLWLTKPLRDENQMPWPDLTQHGVRVWPALYWPSITKNPLVATLRFHSPYSGNQEPLLYPLLQGTEEGANFTVTLKIASDRFFVNDIPNNPAELRKEMETARNNLALLHPDGPQDRLALLALPVVEGSLLENGLDAAYNAGFRMVELVSGRLETIRRPMLGLLSRSIETFTSARMHRLAANESARGKVGWLSCRDYPNYFELLSTAIRERLSGKEIVLVLPRE